jgi:hypothetical protein
VRAIRYRRGMKRTCRLIAMVALLLASASIARAQVNVGIRIGEPPAPRSYHVPPQPGPDFVWIEGYQYPQGSHYTWHNGYWTPPPYQGAYWVAPYHVGGQYYAGRWEGARGNVSHQHGWDKSQQRDGRREPRDDRKQP